MKKAKFASTQINLPQGDAAEVIAFGKAIIPDEDLAGNGRELEPHITLKYGVKEEALTLEKALAGFKPFSIELGSVATFPATENSDGAVPVILKVATDLQPMHDAIHAAMSARDDDFDYSPHVTLAYVKPEAAAKFDGQPYAKTFSVSEVTLSTAGEVQLHIPLGKSQGAAMSKRFEKFIPLDLTKGVIEQADGSLYVYGLVTAEKPDLTHEVCDYATTKPLYAAKASWQLKASSVPGMEPSLMPHRSMHTLDAIGKGVKLDFDDAAKTISMGFEVVDPDAIRKYKKGVYIGFSQGGDYVGSMWPDPVFKGCKRYTANPGEVSAVDSPCLADALVESMKGQSFPLTKANGSVELVKFDLSGKLAKKVETAFDLTNPEAPKLNGVQYEKCAEEDATLVIGDKHFKAQVAPVAKSNAEEIADAVTVALQKAGIVAPPKGDVAKEAKTKRKGGKELKASDFAYVGDAEDPSTWKLPVHDKAHAQNALARFAQTTGIPDDEKKKVKSKVIAAAKKFGVEVTEEATKIFKLHAFAIINPEKAQQMWKSQQMFTAQLGDAAKVFEMQKSLWDVHDLTEVLSTLAFVQQSLCYEREYEGDFSTVPDDLKQVIEDLVQCYVALVDEETQEIVAHLGGKEEKAMTEAELKKGLETLTKAAEHMKKTMEMCKAQHEARLALHKSHCDMMKTVAPEHSALHKAHLESISSVEKSHQGDLHKSISGITGEVDGKGPDSVSITNGGEAHPVKAASLEDIAKLFDDKVTELKKGFETQMEENTTNVLKAVFTAISGEATEAQPGIGDRDVTGVTKVHQTVPVKKDGDIPNPAAPPAVEAPSAALAGKAMAGDQDALLKLARSIKSNPSGIPDSLAHRLTR